MGLGQKFARIIRNLLRKPQVERQLDQELRAYVEMATDQRIASGESPAEARRAALAEFGGVEQVKQAVRDHRSGASLELLWQDARYSLRQLRRNRGFTLTAVITLGLGIGATTAIFSAVYSLLLRPLPYYDPAQLMWVSNLWPKMQMSSVTAPDFNAARHETRSFEQLAAYSNGESDLTGSGDPVRVIRVNMTSNFLPLLGVQPQIGRFFTAAEDGSGGSDVVLLSDRLWRNQFHAAARILGATIRLDGTEKTIIGVLPPHFTFPDAESEPEVYEPLGLNPAASPADQRVMDVNVIGRLRSGVSVQQAQAEMQTFFLARTKIYPAGFASIAQGQQAIVEPLQRHLTGDERKPLLILLTAVGAVLLIACANVANLQLARGLSRLHETALRGALGASRPRIVRQYLIESLILSLFATTVGLLIAVAVASLIQHTQIGNGPATSGISRAAQLLRLPFGKLSSAIEVDGGVLGFTAAISVLTTLLFSLAPAISGTTIDLRSALQTATLRITSGRDQRLLRHALLVAEVGLAVTLLICAGLLIRSFANVLRYDSGFDSQHTLTGVTVLSSGHYATDESTLSFIDRLLDQLKTLPGVTAAAVASTLPTQSYNMSSAMMFEGVPPPPMGMRPFVPVISATPDYFRAVGTPLLRGRSFTPSDTATSPPVTIVNRAFANHFFAGDAIGKRFHTMALSSDRDLVTIIGVAADVRHNGLERDVQPEMFLPMAQLPKQAIHIALRTSVEPASLASGMRAALTAVDPQQPLFDIQTMDQRVSTAVAQRRLTMLLIACFAMLAVILSAVGVYGVFAYSVTQRSQEMGIRLALGSSRGGVLRLVVVQAARLIVLGGILGVGAALVLSKLLASLLVGVTPHDALSFSFAWALMTAVALLASTLPAATAAGTDLVSVLRSE